VSFIIGFPEKNDAYIFIKKYIIKLIINITIILHKKQNYIFDKNMSSDAPSNTSSSSEVVPPSEKKYCFLDNPAYEEVRLIMDGLFIGQCRVAHFKKKLEQVKLSYDKDKDQKIINLNLEIDKANAELDTFTAKFHEYKKARNEKLKKKDE
jgi:hypothetical protein